MHNKEITVKLGFSKSTLLTRWATYFFIMGAVQCIHCRMFSSITGLYPLDVSSNPSNCDNQNCRQTMPNVHFRARSAPIENQ